jgi:hypothetical protein
MGLRSYKNKVKNPLNISAICTWYLKRIYRMNQATRWKENRGQNPHKCVSFRSLVPTLSKIRLQFGIKKNLHLTHTELGQEQFQCANIVFACLWKSDVTYLGCHQGDGSKGCAGEEWGQHFWGSGGGLATWDKSRGDSHSCTKGPNPSKDFTLKDLCIDIMYCTYFSRLQVKKK